MTPSIAAKEALGLCGSRLAGYRKRLRLSQFELAEATGLHWNTIAKIERADADASFLALSSIFIKLGCVHVLVHEEGLEPSEPTVDPRSGAFGEIPVPSSRIVAITGARIRQRREELGLSLGELARDSNLHRNTVWNCERGLVVPSISTLYRLFRSLGVREVNGQAGEARDEAETSFFHLN